MKINIWLTIFILSNFQILEAWRIRNYLPLFNVIITIISAYQYIIYKKE